MGYRDEQSMVFRDETTKVVRKAKAAKTQDGGSSSAMITMNEGLNLFESSTMVADVAVDLTTQVHNQIDIRNPSTSIDDQSTCFFFNYLGHSNTRLPVLPTVYEQSTPSSPLVTIVTSIGMAALANRVKSPEMVLAARQKQTSVLRAINFALQDREAARADSTLITVLLLGVFEVNSPLWHVNFVNLTNE